MRKTLVILTISILSAIPLHAQSEGKNVIRISTGVGIHSNSMFDKNANGYKLKCGPSIGISYSRQFNDWLALSGELVSGFAKTSATSFETDFDIGCGIYLTPFAKWFKHFEIGAGASGRFLRFNESADIVYDGDDIVTYPYCVNDFRFGIDYNIRLYAIRSNRFDLFAFYNPRTEFCKDEGKISYRLRYSLAGIAFGVKF